MGHALQLCMIKDQAIKQQLSKKKIVFSGLDFFIIAFSVFHYFGFHVLGNLLMKEIQKYVMSTKTQLMKKQNAHIFLVFCRIETFHILVVTLI